MVSRFLLECIVRVRRLCIRRYRENPHYDPWWGKLVRAHDPEFSRSIAKASEGKTPYPRED